MKAYTDMEQYISKSAIVAEIEELKDEASIYPSNFYCGRLSICRELMNFLDTFEVKEVDLEKEIKNEMDSLSNLYCYMEDLFNGKEEDGVYPIPEKVKNELSEFAKHFFELGLKSKGE